MHDSPICLFFELLQQLIDVVVKVVGRFNLKYE